MLNKSYWVIYFHFKIFSEKKTNKPKKKTGVETYIFVFLKMCPSSIHFILLEDLEKIGN